jgi:hypothetical protein
MIHRLSETHIHNLKLIVIHEVIQKAAVSVEGALPVPKAGELHLRWEVSVEITDNDNRKLTSIHKAANFVQGFTVQGSLCRGSIVMWQVSAYNIHRLLSFDAHLQLSESLAFHEKGFVGDQVVLPANEAHPAVRATESNNIFVHAALHVGP